MLVENHVKSDSINQIGISLQREGLVRGSLSLSGILSSVVDYVKRALRPQSLEGGVQLDPITQLPIGFNGKIIFSEPANASCGSGFRSCDQLMSEGDFVSIYHFAKIF